MVPKRMEMVDPQQLLEPKKILTHLPKHMEMNMQNAFRTSSMVNKIVSKLSKVLILLLCERRELVIQPKKLGTSQIILIA